MESSLDQYIGPDYPEALWEEIERKELHFGDSGSVIGQGACGLVFKGAWLCHPVAVKEIRPEFPDKNFMREVHILAAARSPFLVQFLGATTTTKPYLIVTELMEHGSIAKILGDHKEHNRLLPMSMVGKWACNIATGLRYLHKRRLIHRDLTPGNILVNRQGTAKISDFGTARVAPETIGILNFSLAGTPAYMAPEVIDAAGRYGRKVDIFSFGLVLYAMVFGENPFLHVGDFKKVAGLIKAGYRPIFPEGARCPDALKKIITSCWDQDYDSRPRAKTVLAELRKVAWEALDVETLPKEIHTEKNP